MSVRLLIESGSEISREAGERHRHAAPYAALVLRGGYVEAGDCGRILAHEGDVLLHAAFEGHSDQFGPHGADILNLPLLRTPDFAFGRHPDPERIVRIP